MQNYKFKIKNLKRKDEQLKKIFKKCKQCNKLLLVNNYNRDNSLPDKLKNKCKKCVKENLTKYKKVCLVCGKEYITNNKKSNVCSLECRHKSKQNGKWVECDYCGKKCYKSNHYLEENKHYYCSRECSDKGKSKYNTITFKCEICGKEKTISKHNYEIHRHHYCSTECSNIGNSGENNNRFNPDLTNEEREKGRYIEGYSEWRTKVYERDNYTCQCCGKYGGELNAHHIYGYTEYKNLRIELNNSITLCKNCHKEYHKFYGYNHNVWEQFKEYLNDKYLETKQIHFLNLIEIINSRISQINNKIT